MAKFWFRLVRVREYQDFLVSLHTKFLIYGNFRKNLRKNPDTPQLLYSRAVKSANPTKHIPRHPEVFWQDLALVSIENFHHAVIAFPV